MKLYKAMLVDDEYIVREGIKNKIDWGNHGFEQIKVYSNGKEAVQAIQAGFSPDLILTDICMPFVNGLDLAEFAAKKKPQPMVIIISGYDDFRFAQRAVKLRVSDYILKPVTANGINEIVNKARVELDRRYSRNKQLSKLEDSMDDAFPLLQAKFLNSLIKNKIDSDKISTKLKEYHIDLKGSSFIAGILDIDNMNNVRNLYEDTPDKVLKYAIYNITQEIAQKYGGLIVFQADGNRTVAIFSNREDCEPVNPEKFLSEVMSLIKGNLNFTISAGIGPVAQNLNELFKSYDGAEYALKFRFYKGNNSIIKSISIREPRETQMNFEHYEKILIDGLKDCSKVCVFSAVDEFLNCLRIKSLKIDRCIFYIHRMMISVANLINEIQLKNSSSLLNEALEEADQMQTETLAMAGQSLSNLCRKFLDSVAMQKRTEAESIVLRSQQYILGHYSDPELSLNNIAAFFSISVSYFCSIFKSHTGKTFLEYLNQIRMERAKELLKSTNRSICEIAENVGYTDQHYFSISFKKNVGVTPKGYRTAQ